MSNWPAEFAIISGQATTGTQWTPSQNNEADQRLHETLKRSAVWLERITGYAPDGTHAEPSWAVELPLATARAVALDFHQDAIYWIAGDLLAVTGCLADAEMVPVDSFRARLDECSK